MLTAPIRLPTPPSTEPTQALPFVFVFMRYDLGIKLVVYFHLYLCYPVLYLADLLSPNISLFVYFTV